MKPLSEVIYIIPIDSSDSGFTCSQKETEQMLTAHDWFSSVSPYSCLVYAETLQHYSQKADGEVRGI